jgi:hypothetical protein
MSGDHQDGVKTFLEESVAFGSQTIVLQHGIAGAEMVILIDSTGTRI